MIWERAAVALLIIGLGIGLYLAWIRLSLVRQARRGLSLDTYHPGRPAILYFTAPGCAPCRSIQRPALNSLEARYGDQVQIIRIDALQSRNLSDHWGVLSLPTTFIIDSQGRPRCVNHGAARLRKLESQLAGIDELPQPVPADHDPAKHLATDLVMEEELHQ